MSKNAIIYHKILLQHKKYILYHHTLFFWKTVEGSQKIYRKTKKYKSDTGLAETAQKSVE
jgi:hypothetical protein